jgi:hypothetical protein
MTRNTDESRRRLLKQAALGAALIPLGTLPLRAAFAAEPPPVAADDPTAKAVGYVDDAARSKAAKPGSKCASCALYQGAAGSAQGGCPIFPGKSVKAAGWCSSWTAKA